jgi:hypothetical protein
MYALKHLDPHVNLGRGQVLRHDFLAQALCYINKV